MFDINNNEISRLCFGTKRIVYIDLMKAIGMYSIVVGHLFPPKNEFIYAFSVPLFFIISGYLHKKTENNKIFWSKMWYSLLFPSLIFYCLTFIKCLIEEIFIYNDYQGRLLYYIFRYFIYSILGFQGENIFVNGGCLGVLWFIYALVLIKVVYQYINKKFFINIMLVTSIVLTIYWNYNNLFFFNSYASAVVSFPFFYLGSILKRYKTNRNNSLYLFLFCGVILYICGHINGAPFIYKNHCGNNILLFYIGAISGSIIIYGISKVLVNYINYDIVISLSKGNFFILGTHPIIIQLISSTDLIRTGYFLYVVGAIIYIIYLPIIFFLIKKCPILLGIKK